MTFNFNQSHDIPWHVGKKKKDSLPLDRLPGIPLNLFTSILNPSWHMDCITQCFRIGTKLYCLTSTKVWVEKKFFLGPIWYFIIVQIRFYTVFNQPLLALFSKLFSRPDLFSLFIGEPFAKSSMESNFFSM